MKWLINKLVDNGWVRLGLSFRWIFGIQKILFGLVNESDLEIIKSRYELINKSGFFSGEKGVSHQQTFIQALFINDLSQKDAFNKILDFSKKQDSFAPLATFFDFIHQAFFANSATAENNKPVLIKAILTHNGVNNALSQAANVLSKAKSNPLKILLNSLTKINCFTGTHSAENKQNMIDGIFAADVQGENALHRALDHDSCPNLKVLLDTPTEVGCFK